MTTPLNQSSTNERYMIWCYDMLTHLATNKHDTWIVLNKGLTACKYESSGLNLRGESNKWPLLDSVDLKKDKEFDVKSEVFTI